MLVEVGLAFLREQARLDRPTSYTDMNRGLANRTGLRPFDFDRDDERAAMGQLISRITRLDRNERGSPFMISALVHYLDENDAGDGFCAWCRCRVRDEESAAASAVGRYGGAMSQPLPEVPAELLFHQAELTSDTAIRYGDLYGILQDLTFVISCCERLLSLLRVPEEERDGVTTQALWTAALIAYERVFAGGVRERLTQDDVLALPNEGAEEVSNHYRWLRDRHIAHSVNPHEISKVCAFVSPPAAEIREVTGIAVLHVKLVGFREEGVTTLGSLATALRAQVLTRAGELETALLEEAKALGVDYLLDQPSATITVPGAQHVNTSRRRYQPDPTPASADPTPAE